MHDGTRRVAAACSFGSALILGLALAGCGQARDRYFEQRLYSMGTWVDIAVGARDERSAAAAIEDVENMLRDFENDYYAWSEDGQLARLNRGLQAGDTVQVSPALEGLLKESQRLSALTAGAFEPGVGELVQMWHFESAPPENAEQPSPGDIRDWQTSAVRIAELSIESGTVTAPRSRVFIDLGGIAKGEAVDRALEILRGHGIENALVNAGGDVRVIGANGDRPWRIGIQAARGDGVLGVVELADGEAAFTSGDYERFYEQDGLRRHHILDPRTGYPAVSTEAITVIADTGVLADAAATAVFVGGTEGWHDIAAALGVEAVLRVDAEGRLETTKPMQQRLDSSAAEIRTTPDA